MNIASDWWKILLLVVALVVLPYAIYTNFFTEDLPQEDYTFWVDITNGDVYRIPQKGRSYIMPMPHPDTGERTLYISTRQDDGSFRLLPRYIPSSPEDIGRSDWGVITNPETGEVTTKGDPINYDPRKN